VRSPAPRCGRVRNITLCSSPTVFSLEAMSDVGVCGEVQVVPAPAALSGLDAVLQPPAPPEPPAPLLQPVTIGAPHALYPTYKPVGMGEPQKGGVLQSSLVDNARRGPQPTICEHNLPKSKCKTCKANARICKHNKKKELCRECDGSALCIHDLRKKVCQQAPRTGHKNAHALVYVFFLQKADRCVLSPALDRRF
jgi:hypothetical protein